MRYLPACFLMTIAVPAMAQELDPATAVSEIIVTGSKATTATKTDTLITERRRRSASSPPPTSRIAAL